MGQESSGTVNVGLKRLIILEIWHIDKDRVGYFQLPNMTSESLFSPLPLIIFGHIFSYPHPPP